MRKEIYCIIAEQRGSLTVDKKKDDSTSRHTSSFCPRLMPLIQYKLPQSGKYSSTASEDCYLIHWRNQDTGK